MLIAKLNTEDVHYNGYVHILWFSAIKQKKKKKNPNKIKIKT